MSNREYPIETIYRLHEINYNKFGSKMEIIEYRMCDDIDIYFPEYDWVYKHARYKNFLEGSLKCPYEPRVFGKGYIGEGIHTSRVFGEKTKCYRTWQDMLRRCYNEKRQEQSPTYKGCYVNKQWLNFQNFANWYDENFYEIEGQHMHLDKDILVKGNKEYGPNTCVFVPHRINGLFIKSNKNRGEYPLGVSKRHGKYIASCNNLEFNHINLGSYNSILEAFNRYKEYKESIIKIVADEYRDVIPDKLYRAMYNYNVEITD